MIYVLISSYILFYAVFMLILVLFGTSYKKPKLTQDLTAHKHKLIVFFPVYKPSKKAVQTIRKQKKELSNLNAQLYVLSQDGKPEIDSELQEISDHFDTHSFASYKGNSYHHALEFAVDRMQLFGEEKADSVLLLDPDNFVPKEGILQLINARTNGAHVAMGQRVSYSEDTSTSLFDGLSERLNDFMFRRAKSVLGLTPELSGSGMLVELTLFTNSVRKLDKIAPGMDKQLLINMMFEYERLSISYNENVVILDEKTEDDSAYNRQRLRWFGNQYYNAKKFGIRLLTSKNLSLIDYGITLWRPPRSFQIVLAVLFAPFDVWLFLSGFTVAPLILISAIISTSALAVFLNQIGALANVIKNIFPVLRTALTNGVTAAKSMRNKNEGTFIHTRIDE